MINIYSALINEASFVYMFLYTLLLLVFIIAGKNVSNGQSFWENALICSLFFILIVGSRYARGNDYIHYAYVYEFNEDIKQPFFSFLNTTLKKVFDLNMYHIFYIYAIPFILAAFKFLKNFKNYAFLLFPLFYIAMLYFEEYEIRQALSFSAIFMFLDVFLSRQELKPKIIKCVIWSGLAVGIHSANLFFIFLFLTLNFTVKKVVSWKISISLLFFASYFFSKYYNISYLQPVLDFLNSLGVEKFSHYTSGSDAEAWFGEEAMQLENARNPIIKVFLFLGNSSLFYFSYKLFKKRDFQHHQFLITITNLYIIGDISRQAFLYLELLNRMSALFQRLWFIPFALVIVHLPYKKLIGWEKLAYVSMFILFYDFIKYVFLQTEDKILFLWDFL